MDIERQFSNLRNKFEVSNHAFINKIAAGVADEINEVDGLNVKSSGKTSDGGVIKMNLSGSMITKDSDRHQEVSDEVRRILDKLKNPAYLLSLIK